MDKEEEALGLALVSAIIFSGLLVKDAPIEVLRRRSIQQAQLLLTECEAEVYQSAEEKR